MADLERIRKLRARRTALSAEVDALDAEIADLIRAALPKYGPTKLARELGISRARIYQIKG